MLTRSIRPSPNRSPLPRVDRTPEFERQRLQGIGQHRAFPSDGLLLRRPIPSKDRTVGAASRCSMGSHGSMLKKQATLDLEASALVRDLHDALQEECGDGNGLELFLARLVFWFFADSSGIFKARDSFADRNCPGRVAQYWPDRAGRVGCGSGPRAWKQGTGEDHWPCVVAADAAAGSKSRAALAARATRPRRSLEARSGVRKVGGVARRGGDARCEARKRPPD